MPTPVRRDPFHQEPLHSLVDLRRASFVERLDIWRHNAPMGHRLRKEIHRRLPPLRGLRLLGPKGWFGIQDGGASSMVIGHNTLMKVMDHLGEKGGKTATYKFHPTEKIFAFGGDARREAAWSVRLPV